MKPTIFYIITQDSWGGAQRYVYDLSTHLYSNYRVVIGIGGHFVHQGLRDRIEAFNTAQGSTIEVIAIKKLKRAVSPIYDLCAVWELRKLYTKLKPSVVHLNSSKVSILGSIARIGLHTPVVYTVHGWVFKESLSKFRTWLYIAAEKITSKYKDTLITLSEEEKNDAQSILHIPIQKLEIIPLGIAQKNICFSREDARKKLQIHDTSTIHLGTIANFYPTKGLDILLDALALLSKEKLLPYQVHIIGDGPERRLLESKIKKYNLEKIVTLHGFIPEAEKLMTAFDICIIPSRKEGLPYSIITSAYYGIPTIATSVGGIPSFAKKISTITLVEPEKVEEMSQRIHDALIDYPNQKKQEDSVLPLEFTLDEMVKKTDQVYCPLLITEQ